MTRLLATARSIEALEFARDLIVRLHRRHDDSGSLFEAAESQRFVRNFMRLGLEWATGRMWLVEMALAGEEDAKIILQETILELQSRRLEMPTELLTYNMQLVRGVRPAGLAGPKKKNELMRNICICVVAAAVCDRFGLKPTGRSARRRSACAVVGDALQVIGMRMSAKAVEAIWRRYGRAMPSARGWAAAMGPLP
jgi:hypothetical protein